MTPAELQEAILAVVRRGEPVTAWVIYADLRQAGHGDITPARVSRNAAALVKRGLLRHAHQLRLDGREEYLGLVAVEEGS